MKPAEDASRDISRLVASISHEILSPVSNITGFTRLLASDPQLVLDENTRDLVNRIRRNSVRLAHLVEEAGAAARLFWGMDAVKPQECDLRRVIEGALKDTAEVVGTGESGPKIGLPEGPMTCTADPGGLRLAVGGVLLNLAKDLGRNRLTLEASQTDGGWEITVWHMPPDGDHYAFTEVGTGASGPSAVLVLELVTALGCRGRLFHSPDGARKITVTLGRPV
jgi:signal transduction histidine kinase